MSPLEMLKDLETRAMSDCLNSGIGITRIKDDGSVEHVPLHNFYESQPENE